MKNVFLPYPTAGGGGVDVRMTLWLGLWDTHVETLRESPRFVPVFVGGVAGCGEPSSHSDLRAALILGGLVHLTFV